MVTRDICDMIGRLCSAGKIRQQSLAIVETKLYVRVASPKILPQ